MAKYLLLLICTFCLSDTQAASCTKWQYAVLSFTTNTTINDGALEKVDTFVTWFSSDSSGVWQNNKPLSGSINQPLTEYFSIKSVYKIDILNELGRRGWEAYGYHRVQISESDSSQDWQFKKCSI